VVTGSEKLLSVKLAHFLVKKQNGLCKKKGPTRQKDFKENSCSTVPGMQREEEARKKSFTPLHVITSHTVFGALPVLPFLGGSRSYWYPVTK